MSQQTYQRVIPRDLFNEAKLLKCLGRLCLLIHDGKAGRLLVSHNGEPFQIEQDQSEGSFYVDNLHFELDDAVGTERRQNTRLRVYTSLNSRLTYPLLTRTAADEEISIFEGDGLFTLEFTDLIHGPR